MQDQTGKVWSADEYALEHGHWQNEIEFAQNMQGLFGVHGYERMQQLWAIRDRSKKRHFSSANRPIPEGADINDLFG